MMMMGRRGYKGGKFVLANYRFLCYYQFMEQLEIDPRINEYAMIVEKAYKSLFFQKSEAELNRARRNPRTAIIEQLHSQIQTGDYTELEACIKEKEHREADDQTEEPQAIFAIAQERTHKRAEATKTLDSLFAINQSMPGLATGNGRLQEASTGNPQRFEEGVFEPDRFYKFLGILTELGCYDTENGINSERLTHFRGQNDPRIMRPQSHVMFVIDNKVIVLDSFCSRSAMFVINLDRVKSLDEFGGMEDRAVLDRIYGMTPDELSNILNENLLLGQRLIHTENWKIRALEIIKANLKGGNIASHLLIKVEQLRSEQPTLSYDEGERLIINGVEVIKYTILFDGESKEYALFVDPSDQTRARNYFKYHEENKLTILVDNKKRTVYKFYEAKKHIEDRQDYIKAKLIQGPIDKPPDIRNVYLFENQMYARNPFSDVPTRYEQFNMLIAKKPLFKLDHDRKATYFRYEDVIEVMREIDESVTTIPSIKETQPGNFEGTVFFDIYRIQGGMRVISNPYAFESYKFHKFSKIVNTRKLPNFRLTHNPRQIYYSLDEVIDIIKDIEKAEKLTIEIESSKQINYELLTFHLEVYSDKNGTKYVKCPYGRKGSKSSRFRDLTANLDKYRLDINRNAHFFLLADALPIIFEIEEATTLIESEESEYPKIDNLDLQIRKSSDGKLFIRNPFIINSGNYERFAEIMNKKAALKYRLKHIPTAHYFVFDNEVLVVVRDILKLPPVEELS
jgi:hypothetical protein